MKDTLQTYHIDKKKFGGILSREYERAFPKTDKNSSKAHSADVMGLSEDVFANMLNGKNQDCLVERMLKFCIHTRTPILSVIDKIFDGDDVDFADDLAAIFAVPADIAEKYGIPVNATAYPVIDGPIAAKEVVYQETKITAQQTKIIESENHPLYESIGADVLAFLRADRAEQAQRTNDIHDAYTLRLAEQYKDQIQQLDRSRQITIEHYEDRVAMIKEQHEQHIIDIKAGHAAFAEECEKKFAKVEELYLKAIHRKNVWLAIVATLFVLETAGVIALLVYDATHPEIGFLRGLSDLFSSGIMEAIRSFMHNPDIFNLRG